MKIFFGIVGILAAIVIGLYLGVWVCLVGGGVDIINEIGHAIAGNPVSALGIMVGLVKMGVAGVVGWGSFYLIGFPSLALLAKD